MSDLFTQPKKHKSSDPIASKTSKFIKKLENLPHQIATCKSANSPATSDHSGLKIRHSKSNSSKIGSFSFQAASVDPIGEDNTYDFNSIPIENKAVIQYIKKSIKKESPATSPAKKSQNAANSSRSLKSGKLTVEKISAAELLAGSLLEIFKSHFKTLVLNTEWTNEEDTKKDEPYSLNSSQVRKTIKNMKNLNLTGSELSRKIEAIDRDMSTNLSTPNINQMSEIKSIYLPSFPVSILNSPHNLLEGIRESGSQSPEHATRNEEKHREFMMNHSNLNSQKEGLRKAMQEETFNAHQNFLNSREMKSYLEVSLGGESPECVLSLADQVDIVNQEQMVEDPVIKIKQDLLFGRDSIKNNAYLAPLGNERSKAFYKTDNDQKYASNEIAFKSIRPISLSSSTGLSLSNQLTPLVKPGLRILNRFVYLLTKHSKVFDAFRTLKNHTKAIAKGNHYSLKKEGLMYISKSPKFSDSPEPVNFGFTSGLDQIPETDSRELMINFKELSSQQQQAADYVNEIRKMQQRMKGIMNFEIIYSLLLRKVYRICFENIRNASDYSLLLDIEPIPRSSSVPKNQRASNNFGSYGTQTIEANSTSRSHRGRLVNKGSFDRNYGLTSKYRDADDGNTELSQGIDIENLEERLERSLETKLESKLSRNLDEKLRGRLQKELIKLFNNEMSSISIKRENSQDRSIQTEMPVVSKLYGLDRVPRDIHNSRMVESADRTYSKQNTGEHQNFLTEPDQRGPYFSSVPQTAHEGRHYVSSYQNISGIRDFSPSYKLEDNSYYNDGHVKYNTLLDNTHAISTVEVRYDDPANYSAIKDDTRFFSPRLSSIEEKQNVSHNPQPKYFLKSPYSQDINNFHLEPNRTDSLYANKEEEKPVLDGLEFDHRANMRSIQTSTYAATMGTIKKEQVEYGFSKHRPSYSFKEYATKHSFAAPKTDYLLYPNSREIHLQKALENVVLARVRYAFYKIQRPYLLQNLKGYRKRNTLNYLLFAKKVEKVYVSRIRSCFTRMCLASRTGPKVIRPQKFVEKYQMKMKRTFFKNLRAFSMRQLTLHNSLGKLVSVLQQKKLRTLSEAFYHTASFSLLKKEYMLNLTLMFLQISEMRKSKMRLAFGLLKQLGEPSPNQKSTMRNALKSVLQDMKLRWHFKLKHAFLKWKGAASNLSVSILNESKKLGHERAIRLHLVKSVKNIFNSRERMNKWYAFYKLKDHTRNLKGALALYAILNKKVWARLRQGYEGIVRSQENRDHIQEQKMRGFEKVAEVFKGRLYKIFMTMFINSQISKESLFTEDQTKGVIKLCTATEELRQKLLWHGLKMIELYNVHKRNQKSLYINLALKLFLLFNAKERRFQRRFFKILAFKSEKQFYKQKVIKKLLRRVHAKNLAYYFNKFKTEVLNVKLSYSMVDLAIKNIILAAEKINKIQRARKGFVLKKLNHFMWEKQQLEKGNFTITTSWDKQQTNKDSSIKLNNFSCTDSMVEFSQQKFNDEEQNRKLRKFVFWLAQNIASNQRKGFSEIYAVYKRRKLEEKLSLYGNNLLKKTIYKRLFLSFAQIKYTVGKRIQKLQSMRLSVVFVMLSNLDKTFSKFKKLFFRKWRDFVQDEEEIIKERLLEFSEFKTKLYFNKWKAAFESRGQRKLSQTEVGFSKLEVFAEHKLRKLCKLAFKRLKGTKPQPISIPLITARSNIPSSDQSPTMYKKQPAKLSKGRSPQPSKSTKPKISLEKKIVSKPSISLASDQSPTSALLKKAGNRPNIEISNAGSPRSRFSRTTSNLSNVKESLMNSLSISHVSSQASSKISTPINNFPKLTKK